MPAGSDLTSKAIAPGSTDYGQRGQLEAGLAQAMAGPGGQPGAAGAPAPSMPNATNPLGSLSQGAVGGDDLPLTDGLSVGPGAVPSPVGSDPMLSDRANRLRAIATEAASPQLRALARAELRRMAREPI